MTAEPAPEPGVPRDPVPTELTVESVHTEGCETRVTVVRSARSAAGRDFVLVAGIGVAASYFEFLAPLLAQHGTVYALDLPGFAGVPRPDAQPSIAFFAHHVDAVLTHYGLDDPVLIGHSMGTQIVTEVLIAHPEFSHAVLVSPVINEAESAPPLQAVRFAQSAAHETVHLALTALSAYILCGVVYFLTVLPHLLRYRISERIARVRTPLLLIRGEFDRSSPRRFHSRLVAQAPDACRWEIEEAAHSIINAHAVGVAALTLRLLDGSLAPKGRLPAAQAEVPPARHADAAMVLQAVGTRAAEWIAALRNDRGGVARAKSAHARLLFRAYARD